MFTRFGEVDIRLKALSWGFDLYMISLHGSSIYRFYASIVP